MSMLHQYFHLESCLAVEAVAVSGPGSLMGSHDGGPETSGLLKLISAVNVMTRDEQFNLRN